MRYTIPFWLRGKENKLSIDYLKIPNPQKSGFTALKLPFDVMSVLAIPCCMLILTWWIYPPEWIITNCIFWQDFPGNIRKTKTGMFNYSILKFCQRRTNWMEHQEYILIWLKSLINGSCAIIDMKELDELDKQKALNQLLLKLQEAEKSVVVEGTVSAELGV